MNMETAVKLAKEGKEEGFNFLYQSTYQKSYYVALKYMKQEDTALDVLQDAYIKAFKSLEQLEDGAKFEAWFSRVVATKALDELRKRKLTLFSQVEDEDGLSFEETFEDDRMDTQPELSMDQAETTRLVKEMIDTLSDEQRMCIMMFYMEEMSVKEIAETLSVSENTVKSRLNYGRKNIKDKVLELEKKGTKLYSVAPFTFFLYLLRTEAQNTTVTAAAETVAANVVAEGVKAASTSGTGAGATGVGKTVGGVAVKNIIAGLAIVVALGGGGALILSVLNNETVSNTGIGQNAPEEDASGTTGEVNWKFEDNVLTIYGEGKMADYEIDDVYNQSTAPWKDKAISKIVVEDGVTYIGAYAFSYQTKFVDTASYEVEIADSVTEIGVGAFESNTFITKVTLPEGLTRIEYRTFSACLRMTDIYIPDSVTYIGECAFMQCEGLTTIDLPDSLQTIDNNAFDMCYNLETIEIPQSVTYLGSSVFMECHSLKSISIPSGVQVIQSGTFSDCYNLEQVNLSEGLLEIQSMAFTNCMSLKSLELPNGLERLYEGFECCPITYFIMPSTVTECNTNDNIVYYGIPGPNAEMQETEFGFIFEEPNVTVNDTVVDENSDYTSNENIVKINSIEDSGINYIEWGLAWTVEDGVLRIFAYEDEASLNVGHSYYMWNYYEGSSAPWSEESVTKVVIEEGVKSIGNRAFVDMPIEEVVIPSSVEFIGSGAFNGCTELTNVKIPEGTIYIGSSAFKGCTSLTEISFPKSLMQIAYGAFADCSNLATVNFTDNIVKLYGGVFENCDSLTSVTLPSNLMVVSYSLFSGCDNLQEVIIPEGVVVLGNYAFYGCRNLSTITIPSTVREIGGNCFDGCSNMTALTLPDGLIRIGWYAFANTSIDSVVIPEGTKYLGSELFMNTDISYIYLPSSIIEMDDKTIPIPFLSYEFSLPFEYHKDIDYMEMYYRNKGLIE